MKRLKKILLFSLALILLLLALALILLNQSLPPTSGEIVVAGIHHPVTIKRNTWGVPLIEARSRQDLFFAIGFLHASDRLFQMDLNRRYATGRLSEIFGERTLELDRFHKDMLVEEAAEKIAGNISSRQSTLLLHYCRGVNAFIDTQKLPPEFTLLNYRPEAWKLKDIASIFKNMELLLAGSGSELFNAKVLGVFGAERAKKLIQGLHGATIINPDEYQQIWPEPIKTNCRDRPFPVFLCLSSAEMPGWAGDSPIPGPT
jgi:penicillin amidase